MDACSTECSRKSYSLFASMYCNPSQGEKNPHGYTENNSLLRPALEIPILSTAMQNCEV